MAFNLLKTYNSLLELDGLDVRARTKSLTGIFKRDFLYSSVIFRSCTVVPTLKEGQEVMDVLFDHLTKRDHDKSGHREYDRERASRLHWVKHHISEKTSDKVDVFSVKDKTGIRTYIFDRAESYVVILEPKTQRERKYYFLITAYYISNSGDYEKMERKSRRKLEEVY